MITALFYQELKGPLQVFLIVLIGEFFIVSVRRTGEYRVGRDLVKVGVAFAGK